MIFIITHTLIIHYIIVYSRQGYQTYCLRCVSIYFTIVKLRVYDCQTTCLRLPNYMLTVDKLRVYGCQTTCLRLINYVFTTHKQGVFVVKHNCLKCLAFYFSLPSFKKFRPVVRTAGPQIYLNISTRSMRLTTFSILSNATTMLLLCNLSFSYYFLLFICKITH